MWNEIILALAAAVSSGAGLKFLDFFMSRRRENLATEMTYREQFNKDSENLRAQIEDLRQTLNEVEREADHWRSEYWRIFSSYQKFRIAVLEELMRNGIDVTLLKNLEQMPDAQP
jgi:uncharacterized protein with gpF-like domain